MQFNKAIYKVLSIISCFGAKIRLIKKFSYHTHNSDFLWYYILHTEEKLVHLAQRPSSVCNIKLNLKFWSGKTQIVFSCQLFPNNPCLINVPLFLASATISSYSWRWRCASSSDLAGRFLRKEANDFSCYSNGQLNVSNIPPRNRSALTCLRNNMSLSHYVTNVYWKFISWFGWHAHISLLIYSS